MLTGRSCSCGFGLSLLVLAGLQTRMDMYVEISAAEDTLSKLNS